MNLFNSSVDLLFKPLDTAIHNLVGFLHKTLRGKALHTNYSYIDYTYILEIESWSRTFEEKTFLLSNIEFPLSF